jgi:8-oxo-dGTP pyrophosphatase MutT (NUDIX family)
MEQNEETQSKKTIYGNNYLDVIDDNGSIYIEQIDPSVVVMPYVIDESGNPISIGIISEISNSRPGGITKTLITGSPNDDDANILQTAIRELKEESGISVENVDKWKFLGNIYTSKMISNPNPCFSVDVSGMTIGNRETDGTSDERDSSFEMMDIGEALSLDDALVSTLFIKHFKNNF